MSIESNIQFLEQRFEEHLDKGCSPKDAAIMAYEDLIYGDHPVDLEAEDDESKY